MAINITDADAYISAYCLDIEDWTDGDTARKTRFLNVAAQTLASRFPTYVIPDNAVYYFANTLSVRYNDTNKNQQNGVASFSVAGISFSFKGGEKELYQLISQPVLDLIGEANGGISLRVRRIGQGVL